MSKELILIPKRKYEELHHEVANSSIKETNEGLKDENQPSISSPPEELTKKKNVQSHVMEGNIVERENTKTNDRPITYVKIKLETFAKKTLSKNWLKFKL